VAAAVGSKTTLNQDIQTMTYRRPSLQAEDVPAADAFTVDDLLVKCAPETSIYQPSQMYMSIPLYDVCMYLFFCLLSASPVLVSV
jgi:hypothetical protein